MTSARRRPILDKPSRISIGGVSTSRREKLLSDLTAPSIEIERVPGGLESPTTVSSTRAHRTRDAR